MKFVCGLILGVMLQALAFYLYCLRKQKREQRLLSRDDDWLTKLGKEESKSNLDHWKP